MDKVMLAKKVCRYELCNSTKEERGDNLSCWKSVKEQPWRFLARQNNK